MLDLVLVGDERRLVDAVPAHQQLVVQSQSQVGQTETLLQREVQGLRGGDNKGKNLPASPAARTVSTCFQLLLPQTQQPPAGHSLAV